MTTFSPEGTQSVFGHQRVTAGGAVGSTDSPGLGIATGTPTRSAAARTRSIGSVQEWGARLKQP